MRKYDEINHIIGQRLKAVRIDKHITQEELAEMLQFGCAQQISDIERGMGGLSVDKLILACKKLDVEADYLLFGLSSRETNNPLNKYISKMTPAQAQAAERIVAEFAKSHGIE